MDISTFTQSDIPARIYRYHESKANEWKRPHLGASLIGKDCLREIWYSFRWFRRPTFDGRMLRLFETGQLAEDRIVAELECIGITVTDRQKRVEILPHFSGSIDGIGTGFAESKGPHILEFKTHNAKSFALLDKGVAMAKPQHYVQMQAYMGGLGIERAYYIAVNKDTDELYAERVKYKVEVYDSIKYKADLIISSCEAPSRIEENPARFACKFCDYKNICHGAEVPEVNCRTCSMGTFCEEGFYCHKHAGLVPVEFQREGCEDYESY
jgi:hypothetical protein